MVVVAPVFVEPLVEGVEHVVRHHRVVRHVVLDAVAEGREEEVLLDALLVHHREASVAVLVLLGEWPELTVPTGVESAEIAFALAVLELHQPLVESARPRDRVERGVWHPGAHAASEHDVTPLAFRDPPHVSLHALVAVASERVFGLVVVVVGVEKLEVHVTRPPVAVLGGAP